MGQLAQSAPPDLGSLCINVIYLLLGLYGWEYVQSLQVEWALLCGRLAFRPSLIPYVLGRASLFVFSILLVVETGPYSKGILCLPGTLTIVSFGGTALACSSTNFMIRTWVIWKDSRLVHALLLLLTLGQWALLVVDVMIVKSIPIERICNVFPNYPQTNAITFAYTTVFDLVVLVLSVSGLSNQCSESPLKRRLRSQGIVYFVIAGLSYVPPMVAALLGDAPVYNLVSNVALTTSTIVSSRAVRSLHALGVCRPGEDTEDVALTSRIDIPLSTVPESACGRRCADEADRC